MRRGSGSGQQQTVCPECGKPVTTFAWFCPQGHSLKQRCEKGHESDRMAGGNVCPQCGEQAEPVQRGELEQDQTNQRSGQKSGQKSGDPEKDVQKAAEVANEMVTASRTTRDKILEFLGLKR